MGNLALDFSGGTNESPELSRFCIQPTSLPRRTLKVHAWPIREAVDLPTIMAGRILGPADAEAVLQAGSVNCVSLGRALTVDAYWPRKASAEIATPIRGCISCNMCFERLTLERDVSCVVDPMLGTEFKELSLAEPQVGDANLPGDFLSVLRDASMAGLAIGLPLGAA